MVHARCAVKNCKSSWHTNKDLRFHQFPSAEKRCKIWVDACKRPDLEGKTLEDLKHMYICNLHFDNQMYGKKLLKKTSVPTLLLPEKSVHTQTYPDEVESTMTTAASQNPMMSELSLCRVCLLGGIRKRPIKSDELRQHFKLLLNDQMEIEDEQPQMLCFICYSQLQRCCRFSKMAQSSDQFYRCLLGYSSEETQNTIEKLKKMNPYNLNVAIQTAVSVDPTDDTPIASTPVTSTIVDCTQSASTLANCTLDNGSSVTGTQGNIIVKQEVIDKEYPDYEMKDSEYEVSFENPIKSASSIKLEPSTPMETSVELESSSKMESLIKLEHSIKIEPVTESEPSAGLVNVSVATLLDQLKKYMGEKDNDRQSEQSEVHSEQPEVHSEQSEVHSEQTEVHSEQPEVHSEQPEVHFEQSDERTELPKVHLKQAVEHSELSKYSDKQSPLPGHSEQFTHSVLPTPNSEVHLEDSKQPESSQNTTDSITDNESETYNNTKRKKLYNTCSICCKEFHKRHDIKIHMRIHNGFHPYACNSCDERFPLMSLLKEHLGTHSGKRKSHCIICNRKFRQASYLKRHMDEHVASELRRMLDQNLLTKQFRCEHCKQLFELQSMLETHVASKHKTCNGYSRRDMRNE